MYRRTRHLTTGVEARHVGAPPGVDAHTAHHVVGRGSHGYRPAGNIQPVLQTLGVNRGKPSLDRRRLQVRNIQRHRLAVKPFHFVGDGAGNHVPGRQVCQRVMVGHKGNAGSVAQNRPFSPHRLRKQERRRALKPQRGGMELVKLHVHHFRAGQVRQGHAVAGRHLRVGRVPVELSAAAGADHHHRAPEYLHLSVDAMQGFHTANRPVIDADANGVRVLQQGYPGGRTHPIGQRVLDVLTRGIAAGMQDPRDAVGALPTQGDLTVNGIERHAPLDQAGDALGTLTRKDANRCRIAQAGSGIQCIPLVQVWRVAGPHCRRDASLGVTAVAVVNQTLGDHQHAAVACRQQRRVQAGNAATDDYVVVAGFHWCSRIRHVAFGGLGRQGGKYRTGAPAGDAPAFKLPGRATNRRRRLPVPRWDQAATGSCPQRGSPPGCPIPIPALRNKFRFRCRPGQRCKRPWRCRDRPAS